MSNSNGPLSMVGHISTFSRQLLRDQKVAGSSPGMVQRFVSPAPII